MISDSDIITKLMIRYANKKVDYCYDLLSVISQFYMGLPQEVLAYYCYRFDLEDSVVFGTACYYTLDLNIDSMDKCLIRICSNGEDNKEAIDAIYDGIMADLSVPTQSNVVEEKVTTFVVEKMTTNKLIDKQGPVLLVNGFSFTDLSVEQALRFIHILHSGNDIYNKAYVQYSHDAEDNRKNNIIDFSDYFEDDLK